MEQTVHSTQVSEEDIKNNLKQFIIDNFLFGDTSNPFSDDDSFMELGIIDSTGILEVINYIEDNYSIKVADNELLPENLDSINNLVNFITRKKETL